MPASEMRARGIFLRLPIKVVFRHLPILASLLILTACTSTIGSSTASYDRQLFARSSFVAPKAVPSEQRSTASERQSTPAASVAPAATPAPAVTAAAPSAGSPAPTAAPAAPMEVQAPATAEAQAMVEAIPFLEPGVIDQRACSLGAGVELTTSRAGECMLTANGLPGDDALDPQAAPALIVAGASAGSPVIEAAPSEPAALHVKLGQTEGLLVAAYQQTGRHYKAGGQAPSTGFDAPGFTRWVYSQRGLNLPRDAKKQALGGRQVAKEELRPGDILVYRDPNGKNDEYHVGIYTGQGNFLHAAAQAGVVTETGAFSPQFAPYFVGGRRYYDDPQAAPLSDNQKMAAASRAVKLALAELGPNDKLDRTIKSKPKSAPKAAATSKSKAKKK